MSTRVLPVNVSLTADTSQYVAAVQTATTATTTLQNTAAIPTVVTPKAQKPDPLKSEDRLDLVHQKVSSKAVGAKIGKAQEVKTEGSEEVKYKFNDKLYSTLGELTKAMQVYQKELNKAAIANMSFGQKFSYSKLALVIGGLKAVGAAMTFVRNKTVELSLSVVDQLSGSFQRAARYMDLSRSTGASISAISRLEGVAVSLGVRSEVVGETMTDLAKDLATAGGVSAVNAARFRSLGLDLDKLAEKTPDEAFGLIAEKIRGIADPMARASAATMAFGDKAKELLPIINNLPKPKPIELPKPTVPKVDPKPVEASVKEVVRTVGKLAVVDYPPMAAPAATKLEEATEKAVGSFKKLDTAMSDLDAAKINEAKVAVDVVKDSFGKLFDKVAVELAPIIVSLSDSFLNLAATGYRIGPIFMGAFKFVAYPIAIAIDAARMLGASIAWAASYGLPFFATLVGVIENVVHAVGSALYSMGLVSRASVQQTVIGIRNVRRTMDELGKKSGKRAEELFAVPSAFATVSDVFKGMEGSAGKTADAMNKAKMDAVAMAKAAANADFFKEMRNTLGSNQSPLTKAKEQLAKIKKMMKLDPANATAYARAASSTLEDLAKQYDMFSTKLSQPLKFGAVETEKTIIQSTQQDIVASMKPDEKIARILEMGKVIDAKMEFHLGKIAAVVETLAM